jgi:hypothetical protein
VLTLGIAALFAAGPQAIQRLTFDDQPPALPAALARAGKSDRSLTEKAVLWVQRPIGTWFDGKTKKPIEFAWLYLPEFAFARLANLEKVEHWHPGELERRWLRVSRPMRNRIAFFVQLAAAPKFDLLRMKTEGASSAEQIENCRFMLLVGDTRLDPVHVESVLESSFSGPSIFENVPWYQFAPNGDAFLKEFDSPYSTSDVEDGAYKLFLFRVDFDLSSAAPLLGTSDQISLRILSRSKERKAAYRLNSGSL